MENIKYTFLQANSSKTNINKLNKSKSTNNFNFINNFPAKYQISQSLLNQSSLLKQNRNKSGCGTIKFNKKNITSTTKSIFNLTPSTTLNKSSSSMNFSNLNNDSYNNNSVKEIKEIDMKNNFSFTKKNYLQTQNQNQLTQFQQSQTLISHNKMDRLCEKLSQISLKKQTNLQVQINQNILNKIQELNQKLLNQEKDLQQNIKTYKQKIEDFYKQMKQIEKRSQFYTSYRLKNIIQLGRKVKSFIQKQKNDRFIIQERIVKLFLQKCQIIESSILSMIKARQELVFKIDDNLEEIIPNFHQELQFQLTIMVEELNQIQKLTKKQVEEFKNMIKAQNIHAKQNKNKIQELMKKTVYQIKAQIQAQKIQRRKNGQKLMQMFEQACLKLTN